MSRYTKSEVTESLAELRKALRPGATVYTSLTHCSRSGMSRRIQVRIVRGKDDVRTLTFHVARVLGLPLSDDGLRVDGAGMDMGFHVVYCLGRALWPNGAKLPKGIHGRNGDTSGYEKDGGYLLAHRWL